MVVAYPAGGPVDTVGRVLAEGMRARLGQPVIIENVSGASGSIGSGRVARAAAVPDFAMEAGEINKVTSLMRGMGWDIGCLYNQETAESPQLYFSHQLKTGDAYALAGEIRKGLDKMNST